MKPLKKSDIKKIFGLFSTICQVPQGISLEKV